MSKKEISIFTEKQEREILNGLIKQFVTDISKVSREAIQAFYDDYTPTVYNRVWGLKNIFRIDVERKSSRKAFITFTYSSEFMTGRHEDDEGAFESAFIWGQHGSPAFWSSLNGNQKPPRMDKSPWEIIQDYATKYYKVKF